jgi:LEA14-like dessication related protein
MNKKTKKTAFILGGSVLAIAAVAYLSTAKKLMDLSVVPSNVGFGKISKGVLPIVVDIIVTNPNQSAVTIDEINGNASMNGTIAGSFSFKKKVTLPGKNSRTTIKKIVINVGLQEAGLSYLTNLLSGSAIDVNINGFLYAEGKQYPFNKTLKSSSNA